MQGHTTMQGHNTCKGIQYARAYYMQGHITCPGRKKAQREKCVQGWKRECQKIHNSWAG